jgi:tight adherence protein B
MFFGQDLTDLAFVAMVVVAVGGIVIALIYPMLTNNTAQNRTNAIVTGKRQEGTGGNSFRARFSEDNKDSRRNKIQESLNQANNSAKNKKKKISLSTRMLQAGITASTRSFWVASVISGVLFAFGALFIGAPLVGIVAAAFVGFLGFPRYVLRWKRNRRQEKFLTDFADAIDVMVRGLKSGLPLNEAMKIIAMESGEPVGPEFMELVDGQKVGISAEQGMERMVERVPLPEVNFLAIVLMIQSKTGGNLSEALGNLSRVLRDRKKMKAKVRSVSQEAKSSAAIIGSLPFLLIGAISLVNPDYMTPMWTTNMGHMLLIGSGIWMSIGVLVMRQMINFQI